MTTRTRYLVLGATGMLGHVVLRLLGDDSSAEVMGTARSSASLARLPRGVADRVLVGVDVADFDTVTAAVAEARPNVVINCVGLVKQLQSANDPLAALPLNAMLPHRLVRLCGAARARLVHISTDCVFAGTRGMYRETDTPDAADLYGRSKLLGEVDAPNAVTLRTSIIGPEIAGAQGLLAWFLGQSGTVKGFTKAVFSGLPTVELARVIRDVVVPRPELRGVYHVAADPISKFDLITLFQHAYGHDVRVIPDDRLVLDRSLDGTRFRTATGWVAAPWPELVRRMREFG